MFRVSRLGHCIIAGPAQRARKQWERSARAREREMHVCARASERERKREKERKRKRERERERGLFKEFKEF